MNTRPSSHVRGFSLIELLVVIGIIALLAGLVVGLAGVAGERKKISRVQIEKARLVMLIESYHSKLGVYPPPNRNLSMPEKNSLVYELTGASRDSSNPGDPNYNNITALRNFAPANEIRSNLLYSAFGVGGLINASDDPTDIKRLLKQVKADQVASLIPGTLSLVVPVDGPNGQPNPWKYATGTNAVHNPNSFDLWVEIVVRGKTNTIGNWKD